MHFYSVIITFVLLVGHSALASSPSVLDLANQTKNRIREAKNFAERKQAVVELKKTLDLRADALAGERDSLETKVEELRSKLDAGTSGSSDLKKSYDSSLKKFNEISREYYDFIELDLMLNTLPGFNGEPTKQVTNCEDAVQHIRAAELSFQDSKKNRINDQRYQATQIGRLLFSCVEEQ